MCKCVSSEERERESREREELSSSFLGGETRSGATRARERTDDDKYVHMESAFLLFWERGEFPNTNEENKKESFRLSLSSVCSVLVYYLPANTHKNTRAARSPSLSFSRFLFFSRVLLDIYSRSSERERERERSLRRARERIKISVTNIIVVEY